MLVLLCACNARPPPKPDVPPTNPDPRTQHMERTERLPEPSAHTVWV
jgi:hypothetical protein